VSPDENGQSGVEQRLLVLMQVSAGFSKKRFRVNDLPDGWQPQQAVASIALFGDN
jgi:hypothetical protein